MALVRTIFYAAASMSAILAVPMPLHNTNNQRLPDHPATLNQSDYSTIVTVQNHKYVPELVASVLRLCGWGYKF